MIAQTETSNSGKVLGRMSDNQKDIVLSISFWIEQLKLDFELGFDVQEAQLDLQRIKGRVDWFELTLKEADSKSKESEPEPSKITPEEISDSWIGEEISKELGQESLYPPFIRKRNIENILAKAEEKKLKDEEV